MQGCLPPELPGSVPDPRQLSLVISGQLANLLLHDGVVLGEELLLEPGLLFGQGRLDLGRLPPQRLLQGTLRLVPLGEESLVRPLCALQFVLQLFRRSPEIVELGRKVLVLDLLVLQLIFEALDLNL